MPNYPKERLILLRLLKDKLRSKRKINFKMGLHIMKSWKPKDLSIHKHLKLTQFTNQRRDMPRKLRRLLNKVI